MGCKSEIFRKLQTQSEGVMFLGGLGFGECPHFWRRARRALQLYGTKRFWSGRWDSNPRRPAWEHGTSLCLQHLRVSDALFRLTQVSPYQSFPGLTLLIEVGSRYIVFCLLPCFVLHPMATNSNGPRVSASHRPMGVKIEFPQRQYTTTTRKQKTKVRSAAGYWLVPSMSGLH